MVGSLGAQTSYITFLETGLTGQSDFIFVRYSATTNGLPSNTQFSFQGNVIKVNRIGECMCNAFATVLSAVESK
jgi:hypothetical protein